MSYQVIVADTQLVDCIDRLEQSKKSGRPISLSLRPNFELLSQLKTLHILFLDENGEDMPISGPRTPPTRDRVI
jgi:hypothetical protein